jgi:L-serine deaminase
MESIENLYIIGPGPSSSHTIGPNHAAKDFIKDLDSKKISQIVATLFGSLALTGKGHLTDQTIDLVLKDFNHKVIFDYSFKNLQHPNTLTFEAYVDNSCVKKTTYYSVGGGKIVTNLADNQIIDQYKFKDFLEIKNYCEVNKISLSNFVDRFDDKNINNYLENVLNKMLDSVELNLNKQGLIPGKLGLQRVAKIIYENALKIDQANERYMMLITSFAYAVVEGNACGDTIVTAPTCGSSGIIPAILYYEYKFNNVTKEKLINALKVAGVIGNICKANASISGAVLGCQAEVGVASSMASAALCYIKDLSLYQIEYASEVSLEHFLGLTCDPVDGYVQIPCIERNGIAVLRSYESYLYAKNISPYRKNKVSFDEVVSAMKMTGESLNQDYKETSVGGLAKVVK